MKVCVVTLHKSASMFLHRYFQAYANSKNLPYFSANSEPANEDGWKHLINGDYVVCPVRIKDSLDLLPSDAQYIIHFRNPIDILISEYFSFGWTHPVISEKQKVRRESIQSQTIDEYCIAHAQSLHKRYGLLISLYQSSSQVILSDYSLMRQSFKKWNKSILESIEQEDSQKISEFLYSQFKGDFRFFRNLFRNVNSHRRDGRDNQARVYLKPETVGVLESELQDIIGFYNDMHQRLQKKYAKT